ALYSLSLHDALPILRAGVQPVHREVRHHRKQYDHSRKSPTLVGLCLDVTILMLHYALSSSHGYGQRGQCSTGSRADKPRTHRIETAGHLPVTVPAHRATRITACSIHGTPPASSHPPREFMVSLRLPASSAARANH